MLQHIPINRINEYWPDVRLGLLRVLDKAPDAWKPEDVYMALMTGTSWLYIAENEDGMLGFVVLTPYSQYGDNYLHIWIAVNNTDVHNHLVFCTDEIKALAASNGIKYITYSSSRKGSLRACKELGFETTHQHFRYEV